MSDLFTGTGSTPFGDVNFRELVARNEAVRAKRAYSLPMQRVKMLELSGLGQEEVDPLLQWYRRAKSSVKTYEELKARMNQIANKEARQLIINWLGDVSRAGTPEYRYFRVKDDIRTDVERFTPINIGAYQVERRRDRIIELEGFLVRFAQMVIQAETRFGKLPAPRIIMRGRSSQDLLNDAQAKFRAGKIAKSATVLSQALALALQANTAALGELNIPLALQAQVLAGQIEAELARIGALKITTPAEQILKQAQERFVQAQATKDLRALSDSLLLAQRASLLAAQQNKALIKKSADSLVARIQEEISALGGISPLVLIAGGGALVVAALLLL